MVEFNKSSMLEANEQATGSIGARPKIYWVGCSDSPVAWTLPMVDRPVLFHSNFGNQIIPSDIGCLAGLEMAINVFGIDELVICGHYGCRAAETAASEHRGEVLGEWLRPIRAISDRAFGAFGTKRKTPIADVLSELNVIEQAKNASCTTIVRSAWESGRHITISGMILDPSSGRLIRIGAPITTVTGSTEVVSKSSYFD